MDQKTLKSSKKYDRVMPRVYNRSRSSLKTNSFVTRHVTPSSILLSGKPSVSNVNSSSHDLPIVLNDFIPECEKPKRRTFVVKPRRTLKSLDPALSPQRPERRAQELKIKPRNLRVPASESSVLPREQEKWLDSHYKQCFSSWSHSKLKDLKDEIQAYHETEKLMKLRSRLYKSCGVVLDDVETPAADKAVQLKETGHENLHEEINVTIR